MSSMPTRERRTPIHPERSPFQISEPLTDEMMDSPKTASVKNSAGPKLIVNSATAGAPTRRTIALKIPPNVDATSAIIKAFLAFPCFARGYPSSIVAAAAFVPGVPIRIALIDPPNSPPQKIAVRKSRALIGVILYVRGRKRLIAIVPVSPGIAPKMIPTRTPSAMNTNDMGDASDCKPAMKLLIPSTPV